MFASTPLKSIVKWKVWKEGEEISTIYLLLGKNTLSKMFHHYVEINEGSLKLKKVGPDGEWGVGVGAKHAFCKLTVLIVRI